MTSVEPRAFIPLPTASDSARVSPPIRPPKTAPENFPMLAMTIRTIVSSNRFMLVRANRLADKPAIPFKVPAGIKLILVDQLSGMRVSPGGGGKTVLEAFKPGTAPPDNYSVIGVADADGRPLMPSPDADRSIMRSGTGGLY